MSVSTRARGADRRQLIRKLLSPHFGSPGPTDTYGT
jgi:hypothetical protein